MHIITTTRCNMSCAHCCMNATAAGEDMSMEMYQYLLSQQPTHITLSGGEPTIHPQFLEFLQLSLSNPGTKSVWMATNGSMTRIALYLAAMAAPYKDYCGSPRFDCTLSLDPYHDPIDQEVITAFQAYELEIREVYTHEKKGGRCDWGSDKCPCPMFMYYPNGDIKACGCDDAPVIGNAWSGVYPQYQNWDNDGICHKQQKHAADFNEWRQEYGNHIQI